MKWRKRYHPDSPNLEITHCVLGLDRRVIYVRSEHSALNTLLQSAGALVCKKWVCLWEENMRKAGYRHGWMVTLPFRCGVTMKLALPVALRKSLKTAVELLRNP